MANSDADYVLGTHDEEVARLGLQHRVWRPIATECWRRAGITSSSRVIDVGAGPGYATVDLAEIVGPTGEVLAVERSARFLEVAKQSCAVRRLSQVRFQEADLMDHPLGPLNFDYAWCRWVASFVSSPEKLINNIAGALRPGGLAIFHEYSHYETFRLAPRRPAVESFAEEVMKSWRAAGGEPDVALQFPRLFAAAGLEVIEVHPRALTVSPRSYVWQWPASFIEINLVRMRELGRVTEEWCEAVRRELRKLKPIRQLW
ncbi:MAG TPA: methyltransferase domain-containing protein [Chthoniobacterales bacterium]|nr:methyltransferase domain-containing protein [Chthoniobacterales bacterium]